MTIFHHYSSIMSSEKHSQTDLYQILELSKDAEADLIKEQYLKLALKYHPDKPEGDLQKFKDVSLAYKVLSDKTKRNEYDHTLGATIEELRDLGDRDTQYHHSEKYLVDEEDTGKKVFDNEAFNQDFSESRTVEEKEEMERLEKELEAKTSASKTLEELMAERDLELNEFQNSYVIDPKKFEPSVFNQMFNDMKTRQQGLAPVEEFQGGAGFSGEPGEPKGLFADGNKDQGMQFGSTPFGQNSAHDYQSMFETPNPDLLTEIRDRVDTYTPNPNIMNVKDQIRNDTDSYYAEIESRLQNMQADFDKNANLDPSEYRVLDSMINNVLGDPELFKEEIPKIEAVKETPLRAARREYEEKHRKTQKN